MSSVEFVSLLLAVPVAFVIDPIAPLLVFAIALRMGWVTDPMFLGPDYAGFASPTFLTVVSVIYVAHALADKIPPVEHFFDLVGVVLKPLAVGAAGFIVSNRIDIHSELHWIGLVVALAGGVPLTAGLQIVHSKLRLAGSVGSVGVLHPFISAMQNVVGIGLMLLIVKNPVAALIVIVMVGVPLTWVAFKIVRFLARTLQKAHGHIKAQISKVA